MRLMAGIVSFVLLAAGCATDSSVRKMMGPLEDRAAALEKTQTAQDAKIDQQAQELAALRRNVQDQSAAAGRAEQAAKEAAAAADRAETAAQKSTKAFELGQVKGTKR